MTVRVAFRLFLVCLIVCAVMVLGAIWLGEGRVPEIYFQSTASLFVIGLASFLIWFSLTLKSIYSFLKSG